MRLLLFLVVSGLRSFLRVGIFLTLALSWLLASGVSLLGTWTIGITDQVLARRQRWIQSQEEGVPSGGLGLGLSGGRLWWLSEEGRQRHIWLIGLSGAGKSRLIEFWILSDVLAGRGFCSLDPHGQLFDHLLSRVAVVAKLRPEIAKNVVIINPLDERYAIGLNPLEPIEGVPLERIAVFLSDVVVKIFHIKDVSAAPRMTWLLYHTFLALAELKLTLLELPMFLSNADVRDALVQRLTNAEARRYFLEEFPDDARQQREWIESTLNKLGRFTADPAMRLIFGQQKSTINFRQLMDQGGRMVLVNLAKGQLGNLNSQLLGAFLVAQVQLAAMSRDNNNEEETDD